MRQTQHNKRARGRGRKPGNPGSRVYESNGPDVKVRGNASHIAEKYVTLARDSTSSGDPVAAENYLQHAEHYFRLVAAAQSQMQQEQEKNRARHGGEQPQTRQHDNGNGASEAGSMGKEADANKDVEAKAEHSSESAEDTRPAGRQRPVRRSRVETVADEDAVSSEDNPDLNGKSLEEILPGGKAEAEKEAAPASASEPEIAQPEESVKVEADV